MPGIVLAIALCIFALSTLFPPVVEAVECTRARYADWECEAWWVWNGDLGAWILLDASWTK